MIDFGRELLDFALRALGDLHHGLPGLLHFLQQRAGEYGVRVLVGLAQPVERRLALPRREQHEHAFGWVHARKPARQSHAALAFDCEGIVAAGIEDEDHRRGALLLQPVREAGRGEGGIAHEALFAWACLGHIDREKVIGAVDGEAVAGEIDERGVASLDLAFELDQRTAHGAASDILS